MIKAAFFDLDGTLVNTLPLYIRSYDGALKQQGITLTNKQIVNTCFGKTEDAICKLLGIPDKVKEFTQTYFEGVQRHFTSGKVFDGVNETLDMLKDKGIKLGIISFAYRWYVDKLLLSTNLLPYFPLVIGYHDVKKPKPDPEAVLLACKHFNVNPSDSVVVGDSKSDIFMSKAAGARAVLFHPSSYNMFYDLKALIEGNPDEVVDSFPKLRKLLIGGKL